MIGAWIQDNLILLPGLLIIAWLLWQRLLAPRLAGVRNMSASEYLRFRHEPHVLVDVRSDGEWRSGHPPSARHIPLSTFASRMDALPKDQAVVLICASGMRSASAAARLARAGHPRVYNFSGGLAAWSSAGLPLTR